ncbi:hypothetical protein RI054_36g138610 [Pseudoscourfieldia marina]
MDAAASSGAAAAAAAESSCTAARWDALPPDFVARLPAYVQRKKEEKGRAAITPYKKNSLRNFALACRAFRDAKRTHVRNIAKIVDIHFARLRELLDGEKAVPQKAVQDVVWNTRSVCSYEIETSGFWLHTLLCASDEDEVRQVVQRNPHRVFYLWLRDVANRIANSEWDDSVHALDLCELSVDTSIARPLSQGGFPLPRVLQDICVDDGHGRGVRIFLNAYTERGEFVSCAELSLHWTAPGEARAAYNDLELEYHSSFNGRETLTRSNCLHPTTIPTDMFMVIVIIIVVVIVVPASCKPAQPSTVCSTSRLLTSQSWLLVGSGIQRHRSAVRVSRCGEDTQL